MKNSTDSPRIIRFVSFPTTRLIDHNGQYYPTIKTDQALKMAKETSLDLVCFNNSAIGTLPLCKLIDFGKWKYENEKKKKQEQKKHRKEVKEIRFSPSIEMHDVQHKINQTIKFLDQGDDVIMVMKLRGREKLHLEEAEKKMDEILALLNSHGKEESRKRDSGIIIVRMGGVKKSGNNIGP